MAKITPQAKAEVLRRFDSFDLDEEQKVALANTRHNFQRIADAIVNSTHAGREQSLALTALEEAKYWVNQSLAKDGELPYEKDCE